MLVLHIRDGVAWVGRHVESFFTYAMAWVASDCEIAR